MVGQGAGISDSPCLPLIVMKWLLQFQALRPSQLHSKQEARNSTAEVLLLYLPPTQEENLLPADFPPHLRDQKALSCLPLRPGQRPIFAEFR